MARGLSSRYPTHRARSESLNLLNGDRVFTWCFELVRPLAIGPFVNSTALQRTYRTPEGQLVTADGQINAGVSVQGFQPQCSSVVPKPVCDSNLQRWRSTVIQVT